MYLVFAAVFVTKDFNIHLDVDVFFFWCLKPFVWHTLGNVCVQRRSHEALKAKSFKLVFPAIIIVYKLFFPPRL